MVVSTSGHNFFYMGMQNGSKVELEVLLHFEVFI